MLVHCSDGWDRTAQLVCLSQLILDPYYRTVVGFEVLIEKDFVAAGHQFSVRLGHATQAANTDKEYSPVFLQFLDCVYQIMYQFPTLFEFNEAFLLEIALHAYSLRFGTFVGCCERERKQLEIQKKTVSLWSYLNSARERYTNPIYHPDSSEVDEASFYPETALLRLRLWDELYLMWSPMVAPGAVGTLVH